MTTSNNNNRKAKPKTFVTPTGVFRFPSLHKPDFGNATYPNPEGAYKVDLILTPEDSAVLEDQLRALYQGALADGQAEFDALPKASRVRLKEPSVNPLFNEEFDKDTEEATGNHVWRFKMRASGKRKDGTTWKAKPDLVDSQPRPMKPGVEIWGGTTGKVSFQAMPYFVSGTGAVGLSLRLVGAQILDLVTKGGSRSAASMGFKAESGGYTSTDDDSEGHGSEFEAHDNRGGDDTASNDKADF